jgi:hypothetical protein
MARDATVTISFRVSAEKADVQERLSRSTRVSDFV